MALERTVQAHVYSHFTVLDAGYGRTAPILSRYVGHERRLVSVDLVEFVDVPSSREVLKSDLAHIALPDGSVDLILSRSVMEHLSDVAAVYREMHRLLVPGGHFIFLTPHFWDYASLAAYVIPSSLHPYIVSRTEGRNEADVFPTCYRSNTRRAVRKLSHASGFDVVSFGYLGQYPSYFMFNGALFYAATPYEKFLARFRALHFMRGWILVVLRKPETAMQP